MTCRHRQIAALALLGVGFMAAACGQNAPESARTAGGPPRLKLAFVSNNAANFWTIARRGTEEAEKTLGNVDVMFRIPANGSAAEQQQILDDLMAAGVDGVAVSPVDPPNETDALNRIADKALLVTQDSDAPESRRVAYIGTDNVAAGGEAGKLIKTALPNGGRIMLFVGKSDAQNAKDRMQGIRQELVGSKVTIIDVRTDDTDPVRAQKNAEDTLVKYPDVACLVGLWSYNGPAILNAVKDGGKAGKVKIVSFDEEADVLNGIAEGVVYGTVVQQPYEFGKQAILRMARYLRGDKDALAGGRLIVPTLSVTKDNVAEFQARLHELLGK
ncbi:MAG: sugar-binding protein [Vicinamibacterales bacterium]